MRKLRAFLRLILGKRWLSNRVLFVKAVIYRFFSVIVTFLISFAVTGNLNISLGISALDFIGKTLLYFVFDVSWNNLMKKM
jgi:uncharacterized membrane protein